MFNLETISLFSQKKSDKEANDRAREVAQAELKRYECFNTLLNGKENLFLKCRDVILQDILTVTRSNPKINRDYLIGYQDAIDSFMRCLNRYKDAMEKI